MNMSAEEEKDLDVTAEDDALDETGDASDTEKQLELARVVPIHAATAPAKRGPGRPKKINPKPTPDDLAYHAEMQRQKVRYIDADELVRATVVQGQNPPLALVLRHKFARNAAELEFHRVELLKYGRVQEASQLVSRHAAVLKDLASVEADINRRTDQILDLRSDNIQKVYALWIGRVREAATDVLSKELLDLFFNRLETSMDGWEDEAESRLR